MILKPVRKDGNRYCGPAVISAIAGIPTSEAARMIREARNKRMVKGTHIGDLIPVFNKLGFIVTRLDVPTKPYITMARWFRLNKTIRTAGRVFLISAGHHWQLTSGRKFVCGQTMEIVSVRDKRVHRRARVKSVWEISKSQGV